MSTLKITPSKWRRIKEQLHEEHPKSVFMLRNRMKQVLGFTVREHSGYRLKTPKELKEQDTSLEQYETQKDSDFHRSHINEYAICLDFYSERKYTMFLLKFSETINGQ